MIPFFSFKAQRRLVEKEEIASSRAEPSDLQSEPLLLTGLLLRYLVAPTGTGPVSTPYEGAALTIKLRGRKIA